MAREANPSVPLFRYNWGEPGTAAMQAQLDGAVMAGPDCTSNLDLSWAGKTLQIVTDGGPSLSYRFNTGTRLTFSENDADQVSAGVGMLRLDQVTIFAHLVPGTLRGYLVVLDEDTRLVTLFEMWFGGEPRKREVTRAVWHGYAYDADAPAPGARHTHTNRVEGKALYWKTDAGDETLDYYPSVAYSHFVELTRLGGRQGYSAPSDYIRLTEDLYLYSRMEAEFSGILTAYVMDLNRLEQVGLRLGFNGADELEFRLFRGTGEWLGQIAKFEEFGDVSGSPINPPAEAKGSRPIYRPLATMPKLSADEVRAVVAKHTDVFGTPSMMAGHGLPPSDALAGREFAIHYDGGPEMHYHFASGDSLSWREGGAGPWTQARYQAWESAPGVLMFGHLLEGAPDHDGHSIVVDLEAGLATCFNGFLNTPYFANEAGARTLFGTISGDGIPDPGDTRHQRTTEMLGRCMTWSYSPGLTSMHLYSTPHTVSWIIFTPDGHGGFEWSGSGDFVKIREGLYFVYWMEEACNGTLGTILINMRTMHDSGISYHCDEESLRMSQVGAYARHAGRFDVERFFKGDKA